MIPLLTIESMIGDATLSFSVATALSPASTAFNTFLMALRNLDRAAILRARRLMVCSARFSADLILATAFPDRLEKRGANSADVRPVRQAKTGFCARIERWTRPDSPVGNSGVTAQCVA